MDIKKLKEAAEKAGSEKWTSDGDVDGYVFAADGDSVCVCHPNAGGFPEFIYPSDRADFIAAANPAAVLELIASHERLVEALKSVEDAMDWAEKNADSPKSALGHFADRAGLVRSALAAAEAA